MKAVSLAVLALAAALPAGAQDAPPVAPPAAEQESPPADLDRVEGARSRMCVGALDRLSDLNVALQPLVQRTNRLAALDRAVALEDSTEVAPFTSGDAVESAVRAWFVSDGSMGRRYAETRDESINDQRTVGRTTIRGRVASARDSVVAEAEGVIEAAGDVQSEALPCEGAIFVRTAVAEACAAETGVLCDALDAPEPSRAFRFVDVAADLWDVEELRPWSDPSGLGVGPNGQLGGARTGARSRRGNVVVDVGLAPMIRARAELDSAQVAEFDANLDSLGFQFSHPRFVMAPALELRLAVTEPIGGETHYFLHFGDLSDPPSQVVWTGPAAGSGPVQAVFPAGPGALARLQAGEPLSLTAVTISGEDATQGDAVYTIGLTPVNQSRAVGGLLGYMAGGQLSADLAELVPPGGAAGR